MFTCKQVSNALAKQDYAAMPLHRRLGVKIHVALCLVCGRYNRQVMLMQDLARRFRAREEQPAGPALSAGEKDSLKRALREAAKSAHE